MKDTHEIENN